MSYSFYGTRLNYQEHLMAHEFLDEVTSATRNAGERVSMAISRQTRDVIASNEALNAENIRATEIAAGQISDTMQQGFGELSGVMSDGFSKISYDIQAVSAGIEELNSTFHWGFSQILSCMGRMNDSLQDLIRIAKTPAQTAAYEQYEIARDAFRQGLYQECMESLNVAINGNQASTGYKLEWRFHQMKGSVLLGFVGCDGAMIDLPQAEEAFLLAARYAKTDFPDHAGKAFLSAGWAAYCQGKMKEALTHTEQAIAINPNLGEALFQAAKINMALGEVDAALPVLGKAIEQDRFYALKAAGDGDFQKYDDKLRGYLDAMRKEKYRQAVQKIQLILEDLHFWLDNAPEAKNHSAICDWLQFIQEGLNKPLLDILNVYRNTETNLIITLHDLKSQAIKSRCIIPGAEITERISSEVELPLEETYQEEVVIKPSNWFRKATTQMQTKSRVITNKQIVQQLSNIKRFGIYNGMEEHLANLEFVLISSGTFTMGDSQTGPAHQVTISKDFYIGRCPITQKQWSVLMDDNPSSSVGSDNPVDRVSWNDCQKMINILNKKNLGYVFRLPTEAEWEYACCAGTNMKYCFGDSESQLEDYAWYCSNSGGKTQPVKKKKHNALGLYDMHGNVWEWCQDLFGAYSSASVTDPKGDSKGYTFVLRGGSWNSLADCVRCAHRERFESDYRNHEIGFRLVCVPVG